MKVILASEEGSDGWLTVGREYNVIGVINYRKVLRYRIIGDNSETPVIYNAAKLIIVDTRLVGSWDFIKYGSDDWELCVSSFSGKTFWDQYFDGDPLAKKTYFEVLNLSK